ncbi:hypothetical protein Poli38472_010650 [Pythium oligandrum]|uniref:RRM domain-containing protein n=1 Tax=Pythium oligandrum TaxID=41045 RepID=A0A8K1FED7_PYTOL|nr:hypothetical protein Poli38472_010650 [Pythium oligandrum]|eukprot:TMW55768.1 hypothetical protein Poli38472_010650 [Pythium oligandrum]
MASKVLYFEQLPSHWTEDKLRETLATHGEIRKIVLLRKRNAIYAGYNPSTLEPIRTNSLQALVEVADVETASTMLNTFQTTPLQVDERVITVSYSKNQELRERHAVGSASRHAPGESNRILLVTVQNPTYPITTDLIHGVFHTYGTVEKIVIFVKPVGLQCLVQFASLDEAVAAKHALNGLSIFPDCCGLVIHFSNLPQELIVKENGLRTTDFTNPNLPVPLNDTAVNSGNDFTPAAMYGYPAPMAVAAAAAASMVGAPMMAPPPIIPGLGREIISPVLLVCNLRETVTCDHLFNLFSCYGNVARVKKLAGKSDHALIQFASQLAAQSALVHLRGFTLLGRSLEISYSKHSYIAIRPGAGGAESDATLMKEYGHGVNRFTGKYANGTKHIYSPTKILHISNLDESETEEQLKGHLSSFQGGDHCKVKLFTNTNGHVQALAEFPSVDAATNVLAQAHNALLGARRLKLAFSKKTMHN